jgi:hypothetical protein
LQNCSILVGFRDMPDAPFKRSVCGTGALHAPVPFYAAGASDISMDLADSRSFLISVMSR